ncbi:MAG: DUF3568 family protein [Nitrospinaceae bacterium]
MRKALFTGILLCLPLMAGCLAVVMATSMVGMDYTFSNVAYKTVNFPIKSVDSAVKRVFGEMGIVMVNAGKIEGGREIKGTTKELKIFVELEMITSKTTKIRVDAQKNVVLKDRATAAAIIRQTEKRL